MEIDCNCIIGLEWIICNVLKTSSSLYTKRIRNTKSDTFLMRDIKGPLG